MEKARITVFDTTLRDGEQSPGCSMNVHEKARLARQLDRLGVDVIEAGFPIASDGDFAAVQAVAAAVPRPVIAALARAAKHDIERAARALEAAVRPRIHVFLGDLRHSPTAQTANFAAAVSGTGARLRPPRLQVLRRR